MDMSHLLDQTATVAPWTGHDSDGAPSYGSSSPVDCKEVRKRRTAQGPDGTQFVTDSVYLTQTSVSVGDRFWPPGADTGDTNAARTVRAVDYADSLADGIRLYEVML